MMQVVPWEYVASAVVSAVIGGLIGGGALRAGGYLVLRSKLGEDFDKSYAAKKDLDGVGSRVNGLETVLVQIRDRTDENADAIIRLQEANATHTQALSRTLTRLDQRLDEYDRRQREDRSSIDRTVAMLDALEKRMDRHSHGKE